VVSQVAVAALTVLWVGVALTWPASQSLWALFGGGIVVGAVTSRFVAARRGSSWERLLADEADAHALALVLLGATVYMLGHNHGVSSDGVVYVAQLRSLVFDHDFDIVREVELLRQPARPHYVVPVGPLVVWSPLYLLVAFIDTVGRAVGWWSPPDDPAAIGLGTAFIRAIMLSSAAVAALGLWSVHRAVRASFSRSNALLTTLLLLGATPLTWYLIYEPTMTHAASFGLVAVLITRASDWGRRPYSRAQALMLGGLVGAAFLVRPQDVLFALWPAVVTVTMAGRTVAARGRDLLSLAWWAGLGTLPALALQAVHSQVVFSQYSYALVGQGGYLDPFESRWLDTLFSSWHGFLSWHPVAYIAVVGTIALLWRDTRWAVTTLVVLFTMAWISGATQDWHGNGSFGGRRFSSMLVLLAPGLALVIEMVLRRPWIMLVPVGAVGLWWNVLLMDQFATFMIPREARVSFAKVVRQQADLHTRPPYRYLFTFPADQWFAWRTGLPAAKYDLLGPESPVWPFATEFPREAERFLLEGWDAPAVDDFGQGWWTLGPVASVAVPLAYESGPVTIDLRSRTRFEEPTYDVTLAIEVNGVAVGQVVSGVPAANDVALTIPAEQASAVFRPGFNVVTLRHVDLRKRDTDDQRPGGTLARRAARGMAWPVAVYRLAIRSADGRVSAQP
jgi:hypothetical protein